MTYSRQRPELPSLSRHFLLLVENKQIVRKPVNANQSFKSPKGTAGLVRILILVLANQITACRFLSGMNYVLSLDRNPGWWTMWN